LGLLAVVLDSKNRLPRIVQEPVMPVANVRHILVKTDNECQQLKERILGGASFADLAKEHSQCPSGKKGGDLGSFGPGKMVREFDRVVFSAPIGVVQGPVKTQFGYHLLEVISRTGEPYSQDANRTIVTSVRSTWLGSIGKKPSSYIKEENATTVRRHLACKEAPSDPLREQGTEPQVIERSAQRATSMTRDEILRKLASSELTVDEARHLLGINAAPLDRRVRNSEWYYVSVGNDLRPLGPMQLAQVRKVVSTNGLRQCKIMQGRGGEWVEADKLRDILRIESEPPIEPQVPTPEMPTSAICTPEVPTPTMAPMGSKSIRESPPSRPSGEASRANDWEELYRQGRNWLNLALSKLSSQQSPTANGNPDRPEPVPSWLWYVGICATIGGCLYWEQEQHQKYLRTTTPMQRHYDEIRDIEMENYERQTWHPRER
jgi:peptidyl-prolyl cis-trans isomerase C